MKGYKILKYFKEKFILNSLLCNHSLENFVKTNTIISKKKLGEKTLNDKLMFIPKEDKESYLSRLKSLNPKLLS